MPPPRRKPRPPNDSDFGPTYPTSDPRLRYQRQGVGHWRFVQAGTGRTVGRVYASERDLLADVRSFGLALDRWLEDNRGGRRGGGARGVRSAGHFDD